MKAGWLGGWLRIFYSFVFILFIACMTGLGYALGIELSTGSVPVLKDKKRVGTVLYHDERPEVAYGEDNLPAFIIFPIKEIKINKKK